MTIGDLGNSSLAAGVLACGGAMLGALAAHRLDRPHLLAWGRRAIYLVLACWTLAALALTALFLVNDFRVLYVAEYSERALPQGYKLAAFWAGQPGSLLLWAWMLAAMAAATARTLRKAPAALQSAVIGVLAVACGFFSVVLLFATNPFETLPFSPPDGQGMNPMLQNVGMILHPPALFLGYAACTIPLALLLGGLIARRLDAPLLSRIRRWTLAAWLFLTVGILLGAQWAYVELGWGGYWAWDPVENASLLPWLTATGLIHSLLLQQRRGMMKAQNACLIAGTFLLCLLGTYLTRSGVVSSVHAFSESPVGWYFLAFLALALVTCVAVIVSRRGLLRSDHRLQRLCTREGAFLAANVLLVLMAAATLVGTAFPLLSRAFLPHPANMGPGFYNRIVLPLGLALAAVMGLGQVLPSDGAPAAAGKTVRRTALPVVAAGAGILLAAVFIGRSSWTLCVAGAVVLVAAAVAVDTIAHLRAGRRNGAALPALLWAHRRRYGGQLAHLGLALLILGVAGSSLYSLQSDLVLATGQTARVGNNTLRLDSLRQVRQANFTALEAEVTLVDRDGESGVLRPQQRTYDKTPDQSNTEVAIRSSLREDVYLTLAGLTEDGQATLQARVNPLAVWIWIGGLVMACGGLVCLVTRRRAATEPAAQATAEPAAQMAADPAAQAFPARPTVETVPCLSEIS